LAERDRVSHQIGRKWVGVILIGAVLAVLAWAWVDGGVRPVRPISQSVSLPGLQP
jgi:HAMP domain-containing protein